MYISKNFNGSVMNPQKRSMIFPDAVVWAAKKVLKIQIGIANIVLKAVTMTVFQYHSQTVPMLAGSQAANWKARAYASKSSWAGHVSKNTLAAASRASISNLNICQSILMAVH